MRQAEEQKTINASILRLWRLWVQPPAEPAHRNNGQSREEQSNSILTLSLAGYPNQPLK